MTKEGYQQHPAPFPKPQSDAGSGPRPTSQLPAGGQPILLAWDADK